jgi:hypothetical protein
MRVFKFWRIAETTVLINDTVKSLTCFGGSNHSESDALSDGHRRLEAVKRRIAGIERGKGNSLWNAFRFCPFPCRICSENREVSGGFIMKSIRDSSGIIPIILLILGAIVALFILLRIISC